MRIMPFMKCKKGLQFAGLGLDDGGGGGGGSTLEAGDGITITNNVISTELFNTTIGKIDGNSVVTKVYTLDRTYNSLATGSTTNFFGFFYDNPISVIDAVVLDNQGHSFKPIYAHFGVESDHKYLDFTFATMPTMNVTNPTVVITYIKED